MVSWLGGGGLRCAVIGGSGGIGSAFVAALIEQGHDVWSLSRSKRSHPKDQNLTIDIEDEASIQAAADAIEGELDLIIIAVGILSDGDSLKPEKSFRHLSAEAMAKVYRINTIGPALCAKHFLPKLPRQRRAVFAALSARVGSIGDNGLGGWHSYRMSKSALNMLLKTCSIELRIRHKQAVCIGLHPGTVDSGLSKPFQANVPDGKLFTPEFASQNMLDVIDQVTPDQTGMIFDYAGKVIPY